MIEKELMTMSEVRLELGLYAKNKQELAWLVTNYKARPLFKLDSKYNFDVTLADIVVLGFVASELGKDFNLDLLSTLTKGYKLGCRTSVEELGALSKKIGFKVEQPERALVGALLYWFRTKI